MGAAVEHVLQPGVEGADWQQSRSWRSHWLCCLGGCLPRDWAACCGTVALPWASFGWTSHRGLRKSFWLEALKYVAVFMVVACLNTILEVVSDATCGVAAEAGTSPEDKLDKELLCRAAFVPYKIVVDLAAFACGLYWAMFVGGPRRRQLRQELGIPPTDANGKCCHMANDNSELCNDDCCLHFWCTSCALCQEARTVLQVELEQRQAAANTPAGYMLLQAPLVSAAPSRAGKAADADMLPV